MRKKSFLIIVALVVSVLNTIFANEIKNINNSKNQKVNLSEEEKAWVKDNPEVTLGGGISFEPFIMYDEKGDVTGYDADIMKLISKRTGLNIKFKLGKWSEIQKNGSSKKLQGLSTAILTKERAKIYNKTKAYLKYTSLIIVKRGNPAKIYSLNDLSGKRVAVQKGNAFQKILLDYGKDFKFVYYDTIHDLIKAVVSMKADFIILDESAFYVARKLMLENMIEAPFTIGG